MTLEESEVVFDGDRALRADYSGRGNAPIRIRGVPDPTCRGLDINPDEMTQRSHDFIKGTKLALTAVRRENSADMPDLLDCLYLAALYDLAAGRTGEAKAHLAHIARVDPGYDSLGRFGIDGTTQFSRYLDREFREFHNQHRGFDYSGAAKLLEEEGEVVNRVLAFTGP